MTGAGAGGSLESPAPAWREILAPYARPRLGRSLLDLATSVVPYLALTVAMYLLVDFSWLLALAIAVPASGFLVRTYIVFHDCAHGSFLPWRGANNWLGRAMALLVYTPFQKWRHNHAVHHATAGDLDRRGQGDVTTLTVAEYRSRSRAGRLGYWLFRHPFVMFVIGPIWSLAIQPRIIRRSDRPRSRHSVIITNVVIAAGVTGLIFLVGWRAYLIVQGSTVLLGGAAGVWLFYVQHQFEDTYWQDHGEWTYAEAALRGSSYLRLPKVLQFFSGNIGLHHVHHLSARIPNYNLQRAHDDNPVFHDVPTLSLMDGLRAVRLKLWDEDSGRLVTFAQARSGTGAQRTTFSEVRA